MLPTKSFLHYKKKNFFTLQIQNHNYAALKTQNLFYIKNTKSF